MEQIQPIEGTKEAFLILINQKGFAKRYDYGKSAVSCWKNYARDGKLSIDKMEEVLTKCGAVKSQDTIWKLTEQ
jgi:hypothetical protein